MRVAGAVALSVVLLVLCACSGGSSSAPAASTTSAPGPPESAVPVTAPPPASHVTFLVDPGRADPVQVAGEPVRDPDDAVEGNLDTATFELVFEWPSDWSIRGLTLCSWTKGIGFFDCFSAGIGEMDSRTHGPDFVYELWLMEEPGSHPVRRLVALDPRDHTSPIRLRLAEGYGDVNDVLSMPPLEDGNYLVPVGAP